MRQYNTDIIKIADYNKIQLQKATSIVNVTTFLIRFQSKKNNQNLHFANKKYLNLYILIYRMEYIMQKST